MSACLASRRPARHDGYGFLEPPGGRVVVSVRPGASIDVTDHGGGVAPEDREAIFEPFWRRQDGQPGVGLGLAIVREIARLHGGDVSVLDTPGGGATFRLTLQEGGGDAGVPAPA